jgi:hypothetical protein
MLHTGLFGVQTEITRPSTIVPRMINVLAAAPSPRSLLIKDNQHARAPTKSANAPKMPVPAVLRARLCAAFPFADAVALCTLGVDALPAVILLNVGALSRSEITNVAALAGAGVCNACAANDSDGSGGRSAVGHPVLVAPEDNVWVGCTNLVSTHAPKEACANIDWRARS